MGCLLLGRHSDPERNPKGDDQHAHEQSDAAARNRAVTSAIRRNLNRSQRLTRCRRPFHASEA
jgi:hypothetical protein